MTGLEQAPIDSKLAGAALRSFFNLARVWELTEAEQMRLLGVEHPSVLHKMRAGSLRECGPETLMRISYLLGIFKAIRTLLPDPGRADVWMRAPNKGPLFGGASALDFMLRGGIEDLRTVRQYLDAQIN